MRLSGAVIQPRLAACLTICMQYCHTMFDDCLSFTLWKPWDDQGLGKPPETTY